MLRLLVFAKKLIQKMLSITESKHLCIRKSTKIQYHNSFSLQWFQFR